MKIADTAVRLSGIPRALMPAAQRRYAAFLTTDADLAWDLDWDTPPQQPAAAPHEPVVFEHTGTGAWRMAMNQVQAQWDPGAGLGRARMGGGEYALDGLLRVWYSAWLIHHGGGGLFHAAGAVRRGAGRLFVGRSGAGKSTLAATCAPAELLSDELVAVRLIDNEYRVYGTPFMGELGVGGQNISGPLGQFYLLDRHSPAGATPVPRAQAASELWSVLLCFDTHPDAAHAALGLCNGMAAALPCERLSFDPTLGPWRLLDAG